MRCDRNLGTFKAPRESTAYASAPAVDKAWCAAVCLVEVRSTNMYMPSVLLVALRRSRRWAVGCQVLKGAALDCLEGCFCRSDVM